MGDQYCQQYVRKLQNVRILSYMITIYYIFHLLRMIMHI